MADLAANFGGTQLAQKLAAAAAAAAAGGKSGSRWQQSAKAAVFVEQARMESQICCSISSC